LALASCPAREGQHRSLRRMRRVLSWALARSLGPRSLAWAWLAAFCEAGLFRPLWGVRICSPAPRPTGPMGQVLDKVNEVRILAEEGWGNPAPYNLTILMVVNSDTLPYGKGDDVPSQPRELTEWLRRDRQLARSASQIASKLLQRLKGQGPLSKGWLSW